jgi:hypothetical protein
MFLDDCVESFLILIRSHPYARAGHPDFIAIGRLQIWIRHTEFVALDFPGPGPFSAHFVAKQDAVGPQITDPMGAIGNIPANDPGTDFLLAEQFEHFLSVCGRSKNRRGQQGC